MRSFDDRVLTSRLFQPARFLLLSLVLLTLISFSGTVSLVSAQTAVEVCRETKAVSEQLKREEQEVITLINYKNRENELQDHLSILNKAITKGTLLPIRNLKYLADSTLMKLPKEAGKMTVEERAAFQRQARNLIVQRFKEISDVTLEELDQKLARKSQQLKVRKDRYNALGCEAVLRNRTGTTGACAPEGSWKHSTDVIGSTTWRIMPDGKAQETGIGNAEGTAKLTGRTLQINWKTKNGYSGVYQWKLDENCSSGSGSLTFQSGTTGTFTSRVKRQ